MSKVVSYQITDIIDIKLLKPGLKFSLFTAIQKNYSIKSIK